MNQINFTYQTASYLLILTLPFLMFGIGMFVEMIYIKFYPLKKIVRMIDSKKEMLDLIAKAPFWRISLYITITNILEELVFRMGGVAALNHFQLGSNLPMLMTAAIVSSLIWGLIHYMWERSIFMCLFRSFMGMGFFFAFVLFETTFGMVTGFLIICAIHLFYNFILNGLIFQKTWTQRRFMAFYSVLGHRDVVEEFKASQQ